MVYVLDRDWETIAPNAFSQKQIDNGIPDMVRRGELVAYIGNNGQVLAVVPSELETIKNARAARATRAARSKGQEGDYSAIVEQMYELLMKYNSPDRSKKEKKDIRKQIFRLYDSVPGKFRAQKYQIS